MVARSGRKETRRAAYQDVLDAPPHKVAEVIAGRLHTHPRPASRHAWASSGIGAKISPPFNYGDGGPGGWWIVFEPELHLAEDIVVPDLAGWRRETMPEYPDVAFFTTAPDWVCEVLSPSTRRLDLSEKRSINAREGVRHLWFVDPDARTLEAFEFRDEQWLLLATLADDAPVSLPPFDAITFPLDALWPEVITRAKMADNGDGS
ncbi:MAG: Uma2 family endonuclease [Boseongicola sp. SB0673_bin_14]|nr:Uma2 family endonuclease [Boseongicola sp. SB0667_bin_21]MYI68444.1 Uma2 family endonuclease [Boseongicola sp. SB0673_bin_14]